MFNNDSNNSRHQHILLKLSDSIEEILHPKGSIVGDGALATPPEPPIDPPPPPQPPLDSSYYVLPNDLIDSNLSEEYSEIFQPLLGTNEFFWLQNYADVLSRNPRTLKRILNTYSVFRRVRKFRDPNADVFDDFASKLLKLVIMSEQWPFAFAWILQVITTIQNEFLMLQVEAEESNSTSNLFSERYFLSRDLNYDLSNNEGWKEFGNVSIRDLFLKIEKKLFKVALQEHLHNEHIEHFMILCRKCGKTILRVHDFTRPLDSISSNLHGYILNMPSYTMDSVRLQINKYMLEKQQNNVGNWYD